MYSWTYSQLSHAIAIPVHRFSGVFALFDVPMSYGRYWVTLSLDNISPERGEQEDDEDAE